MKLTIEETEQIREDYVYEIVDENDDIIETDFVCLESAIEYALENGGVCINRLWYPLDEYGDINYYADVLSAEIVWQAD